MKRFHLLFLIPLFALLTACSPIVRPEQLGADQKIALDAGNSVGQTFVAEYDGLMGVEITIRANTPSTIFYILSPDSPHRLSPIDEITLQPSSVPVTVRLPFDTRFMSAQESYRLSIETESTTPLTLRAASGITYLNGSAYQNGEPLSDVQLAFRLVYHPGWLMWGLVKEAVSWLGWVLAAGFLFVLPGWGVLTAVWPGWDGDREHSPAWAEKLALSVGVSLAMYPVLFAWAGWVNWGLGEVFTWGVPLMALAFLAWRYRQVPMRAHLRAHWQSMKSEWITLPSFVLILALGLLFLTRFWAIRHVGAGLWGDSVHHTLITQLIVEHGGLFDAWEPYNDLQSFTYHFGFHANAAVFHWLTGVAVPRAVVVFGQLVNVFALWTLIPLANRITGLKKKDAAWAGVAAVILAGLVVNQPAFYVNWGRYTQLAGQAILPVALWLVWDLLEPRTETPPAGGWRRWVVAVVLCGLALTHYRVMIFAGAFFVAYGLVRVWRGKLRPIIGHVVGVGALTGILFAPWLVHLFAGKLVDFLSATLSIPASEPNKTIEVYNQIGDLRMYLPMWVWWGLLACLLLGLFRRNSNALIVGGWMGLMLLIANPGWVGLPGAGAVNNFSVFIAAYLPAGVLVGAGLAWGMKQVGGLRGVRIVLALVLVAVAVRFSPARMAVVEPANYALATPPDIRAGTWIQEHLPQEALILVNSFAAFEESSVVGSDGGWWMSLLGQRKTTLPPILYVSETGPRPDYLTWINAFTFLIEEKGVTHPDVIAALIERGVTHVYIGQLQGRVGHVTGLVIEPETLLASPHFRPVYHEDRVWVFEFLP